MYNNNIGFPHSLNIAFSYENLCKPKCCKVKNQLPLTYAENYFSVPRRKK